MTTLAIKINHTCTGCGNCDNYLPGVREEINKRGSIFANIYNPDVDWEAITEAIQSCEVGAFELEPLA